MTPSTRVAAVKRCLVWSAAGSSASRQRIRFLLTHFIAGGEWLAGGGRQLARTHSLLSGKHLTAVQFDHWWLRQLVRMNYSV